MSTELPPMQEFSLWDGTTPFFDGSGEEARRAYVVKLSSAGEFKAYGVVGPDQDCVFQVHGTDSSQLDKFVAEMKAEGASITYGTPPFETQTGGDKPPTKDPSGIKSPRPMIPQ